MSTKTSASKPHLFDRLILATKAFLDRNVDERQLRETVHDISEANLPYKIVPLSSLTRKEILKAFNLKVDTRDNELENVMPMPIPKHLEAHGIVSKDLPYGQFLNVQTERAYQFGPVRLKGKRVYLGARLDYGIWYEEDETLCLNVLIVEAKRSDIELGATQALGYMGEATIHNERKKSSKRDATVYGMTSVSSSAKAPFYARLLVVSRDFLDRKITKHQFGEKVEEIDSAAKSHKTVPKNARK
ncbi:hypothetical protein CBS147311_3665 [Penicillium roqueforti]|nr:hypothetical protein CBS147311_3665 [Penicillium roqueforti]